jgi:hypothetical protein
MGYHVFLLITFIDHNYFFLNNGANRIKSNNFNISSPMYTVVRLKKEATFFDLTIPTNILGVTCNNTLIILGEGTGSTLRNLRGTVARILFYHIGDDL